MKVVEIGGGTPSVHKLTVKQLPVEVVDKGGGVAAGTR